MRVLIDGLSARAGGGLTYIRYILPALVSEAPEHEFHVLLSERYQKAVASAAPREVKVVSVDLPPTQLVRRLWFLHGKLPGIVRRGGYDIVLAVAESSYPSFGRPLVVLARNPTVYKATSARAAGGWRSAAHRWIRAPFIHRTLRRADRVVFVSEAFRDSVAKELGLTPSRVGVIHHGVSRDFRPEERGSEAVPRNEARYLLSVSSIQREKNYETLLTAFAALRRRHPSLRLLVAGKTLEPKTHRSLCDRVRALGISDAVEFLGEVDHSRLATLYRQAEAVVLPSFRETFGHPLVESMASGTPVICSDLPVCREICGDAALFFPPTDPQALEEKLDQLIDDRALRETLARRGRARSLEFSWEKSARGLVAVLQEALEARRESGTAGVPHGAPGRRP